MKELVQIQSELKAPKDKHNSFGNYDYRSCESILEALKPLLLKYNCFLTISDKINQFGDRFYVEAVVTLTNSEGKIIQVSASAREALVKKGMDESQITGASSSYARKYALNGLFAIDDTKDADATNTHEQEKTEKTKTSKDLNIIPYGESKGKTWQEIGINNLEYYKEQYEKGIRENKKPEWLENNKKVLEIINKELDWRNNQ